MCEGAPDFGVRDGLQGDPRMGMREGWGVVSTDLGCGPCGQSERSSGWTVRSKSWAGWCAGVGQDDAGSPKSGLGPQEEAAADPVGGVSGAGEGLPRAPQVAPRSSRWPRRHRGSPASAVRHGCPTPAGCGRTRWPCRLEAHAARGSPRCPAVVGISGAGPSPASCPAGRRGVRRPGS